MLDKVVVGVVLVAAGLLLTPAPAVQGEAQGQPPEDTRPGRAEFIEMGCYQCHGYEGQGARGTGPRLAPEPLPLDLFSNWVRRPPEVMPAYSPNILSDDKLERIHDYLESIPPPPDVSTLPALNE